MSACRADALKYWFRRREALSEKEAQIHSDMHEQIQPLMRGKSVAVFREMLLAVGFPHVDLLIEHFTLGFPLVGMFPVTGVFPPARKDPLRSESDLTAAAESIREEVLAATGPGSDPELDRAVYEATMEEVKRGWLTGPLSISQLAEIDG